MHIIKKSRFNTEQDHITILPSYVCFQFYFQSFIELGRIKKCFTMKGGIFILEEFGKTFHASFSSFFLLFFLFVDVKIETVKIEYI